jgi:hypothetical protein
MPSKYFKKIGRVFTLSLRHIKLTYIHTYIYDGIKGGVLMELSTYIKMERNKKKRGKVEIWSIE